MNMYRPHLVRLAERPQTLAQAKIDKQVAYAMLSNGWVRCDKRVWSVTCMGRSVIQ